jgi:xanthine dehydrogenase accessory factor
VTGDRSGFAGEWFLGVHNPPLRMAVVGAVHIAQALVPMATLAGYDVLVVDPREAFATEARFPGARLSHDWPDAALEGFGLDTRTAVVTLTHDPKLDDPAIRAALAAPVFYLGCLGSTRTHAKRVGRLTDEGFGSDAIARIHAPIGADIGAQSPAEIAVAILAEITERLRRPATRP